MISPAVPVFSLSLALRLILLGKGPYHYDTVELVMAARTLLESGRMQYMHGAGYPLHVCLGALWIAAGRLFGLDDPATAVNLMAAVLGSLAVTALFVAVRRLLDLRAAIFSAVLFSVLPGFLSATVYGINNGVSACFGLAALACMLSFSGSGKKGWVSLAGLCMACCAAIRLPDIIFCLPLWTAYVLGRRRTIFPPAGLVLPVALVTPLFYLPMALRGQFTQMAEALADASQGKFNGPFSPTLSQSFQWMVSMFSLPGILCAAAGLGLLFLNGKKRQAAILVVWLLALFFYYGNVSTVEPRMLALAAAPLAILAGYGLAALPRIRGFPWASSLACAALAAVMVAPVLPTLWFRHTHAQAQSYFSWLQRKTEPHALIIAADEQIFIRYYTSRACLAAPRGCDRVVVRKFFDEKISPALAAGIPLYLIDSAYAYDSCGFMRRYIRENFTVTPLGSFRNEDWHHACVRLKLHDEGLSRITPMQRRGE